jgi:hypothetical protein
VTFTFIFTGSFNIYHKFIHKRIGEMCVANLFISITIENKIKLHKLSHQIKSFKVKVRPITGPEGPEVSRVIALLIRDFGARRGGWSAPRPGRFTPGNDPVPIVQEAG